MRRLMQVASFLILPFIVEASETVKLKGYLGERLDAMIEKSIVGTDVDYLTVQFSADADTSHWWQTEFWGKWKTEPSDNQHPFQRYSFQSSHQGALQDNL